MVPFLVAEIVGALVALVVVVIMVVQLARPHNANLSPSASDANRRHHRVLAMILVAAAAVHGIAAMLYASNANVFVYVCGWLALAMILVSGICMIPGLRHRLAHAASWHNRFFIAAIVLILAHILVGRI